MPSGRWTSLVKLLAWAIAFAGRAADGRRAEWLVRVDRWPRDASSTCSAEFNHVSAEQMRATVSPHLRRRDFSRSISPMCARRSRSCRGSSTPRCASAGPTASSCIVTSSSRTRAGASDRAGQPRTARCSRRRARAGLQGLPQLVGPGRRARRSDPVPRRLPQGCSRGSGLDRDAVALSPRGGWTLTLASGASSRSAASDPRERLARFLDAWPKLAAGRAGHAGVRRPALRERLRGALGRRRSTPATSTTRRAAPPMPARAITTPRLPNPGFHHMNRKAEKNLDRRPRRRHVEDRRDRRRARAGRSRSRSSASARIRSHGLKRGVVVDIESTVQSIQRAIEEAELMAGCQIRSVYASIAGSHIKDENSHGMAPIRDKRGHARPISTACSNSAKAVAIPADQRALHASRRNT